MVDSIILDLCWKFNVTLAQVGPTIWRFVACFRHLLNLFGVSFSLQHILHLHFLELYRRCDIIVSNQSTWKIIDTEDDFDKGWYDHFVAVLPGSLPNLWGDPSRRGGMASVSTLFFFWNFLLPFIVLSLWNAAALSTLWEVPHIEEWVKKILSFSLLHERSWRHISELPDGGTKISVQLAFL